MEETLEIPEELESKKESLKFLQQTLLSTVSRILHDRKLIEPKDFQNFNTHILNKNTEIGEDMIMKIRGACEALELDYLEKFILIVQEQDGDPDEAVEAYTWEFLHEEDNISASFTATPLKVKLHWTRARDQIKFLLQYLHNFISENTPPIEKTYFPAFRLLYNDRRPADYQAKGFEQCNEHQFVKKISNIYEYGMKVPFLKMLLRIETTFTEDGIEQARDEIEEEVNESTFLSYSFGESSSFLSTSRAATADSFDCDKYY